MRRERLWQIVLVIVGLLNLAIIYPLHMDLRHSSWPLGQKNSKHKHNSDRGSVVAKQDVTQNGASILTGVYVAEP